MLQCASNSTCNAKHRTFVFAGRCGTSEGSQTLRNNRKSQENDQNFTKPPFQVPLDFQASLKPPFQSQLDIHGPSKPPLQGQLDAQGPLKPPYFRLPCLPCLLCLTCLPGLPYLPCLPCSYACLACGACLACLACLVLLYSNLSVVHHRLEGGKTCSNASLLLASSTTELHGGAKT